MELFPSWEAVRFRYREVVLFAAGQMKDSRPLVQHMYEMQVEFYLNELRTGGLPYIDADLFKLLHKESTVRLFDHPLHNKYINYYEHWEDEHKKRPYDITAINHPCKIYHFRVMKEDVVLGKYKEPRAEIPECGIYIYHPDETVTKNLLSKCRMISKHQPVTDLWMRNVDYHGLTEAEAPTLSHLQSLCLHSCNLSTSFMRNILQQLHDCVTLTYLKLQYVDLREVEEDLDELLDNFVSNHEKGLSQEKLMIIMRRNELSREVAVKWNEHCEGITSIDYGISQY